MRDILLYGVAAGLLIALLQLIEYRFLVLQHSASIYGGLIAEAALATLGITPREFEILELIAGGLSNREIASRLFLSENTVKTHASRLLDKLNARRRTQAVQIAKEKGLIP